MELQSSTSLWVLAALKISKRPSLGRGAEFFERTRGLTFSALAMVGFEALQQLIHIRVIVQNIRSSRPANGLSRRNPDV